MTLSRRVATATLGLSSILAMSAVTPALAADDIKVGILRLTSHSPAIIAKGKGYFDEAGLNVEFVPFQSAQPIAVGIASFDIDFGSGGCRYRRGRR